VLTALLVLPLVSTFWSINPSETINRAIAIAGSSLFGPYLAAYLPSRQTLTLLAVTATIAAAASIVLIAAVPSLGIDQLPPLAGSWTGAFGHKNMLGQMSSLGVIVCLLVVLSEGWRRAPVPATGCVLNAAPLAGSQSLTAQAICVLSVAVILLVHRFVRTIVTFGPVIVCALAVTILMLASTFSLDDIFALLASLGKDPTLSSRLPLWQSLVPFMMERFWLGHGYEAFWSDTNYAVRVVVERVHFRPWYAHNGLIELWLGLGITGAALMAYVLGRMIGQATARLAVAMIVILIMSNAMESSFPERNDRLWCLTAWLYLALPTTAAAPRREVAVVPRPA
jgi:exopolysaccharide production protein ExoQ